MKTSKTTVREFATRHDIDNVMANSVLQFLTIKGIATMCDPLKIKGKKGKPQNVFDVPAIVTWEEPVAEIAPVTEIAPVSEVAETPATEAPVAEASTAEASTAEVPATPAAE